MTTFRVISGNCGEHSDRYKKYLEKKLPEYINLDFIEAAIGSGGGMFDDDGSILYGESNKWWDEFCNS